MIDYIGMTCHKPPTILEALKRFDLDTVLLPVNFVTKRNKQPGNDYEPVLNLAKERNIGVIAMKALAKRRWPSSYGDNRPYYTWYEPFDSQEDIDRCNGLRCLKM